MTPRLTREAVADLSRLYIDGFETFGSRQADRYAEGLEATLGRIAAYPRMACERPEFDPPLRLHPYGSHLIVYLISEDEDVLVIRILNARQDWQAALS
ncbi:MULTISPECIES: type II toxin-antitoxin system RelE/ParE family toxin [unclassified Aureimonas]|uniref:type II toxin-antitoxin system RelE/ParE family toxin n=1 Tax=unclassified Aureimonas TaxID=2615206 RepID=UPI0006F5FE87|nr:MULTISPECIES: type II toxin-antitoxin system RelE/ParE family toxin [unclassified Aureimonas]KQT65792.1 hypothetical protein ASG62_21725 [Aureimonas sp. Leaf427]KQT74791.1 hypothetical protein ASG54_16785 [Aureimonas sp. Leaf460]